MDRLDLKAFNASALQELCQRSSRRDDVRALRQGLEREDFDEVVFRLLWVCADQADWLQEMLLFKGPNIGRTKSHIANHQKFSAAYADLFVWLTPRAKTLLDVESDLDRYSPTARARHVLRHLKKSDFIAWQKKNKKARSRWEFGKLTTDYMVKQFAAYLSSHESRQTMTPHERLVDPRLRSREPSPMMLGVLRQEHQEAVAVYQSSVRGSTALDDLPEFLSVEETATYLAIGKSLVYEMVKRGELRGVRFGRLIRVPREALRARVTGRNQKPSDS
jgi:excisionase family DNA binding protein